MSSADALDFVVGEEKRVGELLVEGEVLPLLRALVSAGATGARIVAEGEALWSAAEPDATGEPLARFPLSLEGEVVATLEVCGPESGKETLQACARLLSVALQTLLRNSLKRVLTTEIHTSVVHRSYEDLVESNRQLAASEARYRELSESLETRVKEREAELRRATAHLLQQEKMAAVGQLAAGVAHEINNPLGFITSNLNTLQKYVARLTAMLQFYRDHVPVAAGARPEPAVEEFLQAAKRKWAELKVELVLGDVGDLLTQSVAGAERVTRIVADLKGFSHIDEAGTQLVDLNAELERTFNVLSHQLKDATIVRKLQPLPPIPCQPQLPGQIFLNVVQNAVTACGPKLTLTVGTAWDGKRIRISIADNGPGVPGEIRGRIFEPFFTTAEVGKGTGMGLAVVYESVTSLGGTIAVGDAPSGGAEFTITIPVPPGGKG